MDSVTILLAASLVGSVAVNIMLLVNNRQATSGLKEIAREALLASRAESAGDLATASLIAHQAAQEREQKPVKQAKPAGTKQEIPVLKGLDGRPIFPMRPVG